MESYQTTCNNCGQTRHWAGYKTRMSKTPEQLALMEHDETTCKHCGSKEVKTTLDHESEEGRVLDQTGNLVAQVLAELILKNQLDMLELLHQAENSLTRLLSDESKWQGLLIDYHKPFVERLWHQWGEHRIYLHRIYPCDVGEALFHPHPWPSAMKVLRGSYEMGLGYGTGSVEPPKAARLILGAGSEYEMSDPDGWHYVRPLAEPSLSLMVTGQPWKRSAPKSDRPLQKLKPETKREILELFRLFYK